MANIIVISNEYNNVTWYDWFKKTYVAICQITIARPYCLKDIVSFYSKFECASLL